jgi:Na+-translocating ferredoxin:NAD+ oxidoreductase RNF subunit RnfB
MNNNDLFRLLIKSYYENSFKEAINSLLQENMDNKAQMSKILAALCGVEANYTGPAYVEDLEKAIKNYTSDHKVVTKIKSCGMECSGSSGKTNCQNICHFDAIFVEEENHTTFIDHDKCIGCGFCVDACPNNCYMDKVEFIPLLNSL